LAPDRAAAGPVGTGTRTSAGDRSGSEGRNWRHRPRGHRASRDHRRV